MYLINKYYRITRFSFSKRTLKRFNPKDRKSLNLRIEIKQLCISEENKRIFPESLSIKILIKDFLSVFKVMQ